MKGKAKANPKKKKTVKGMTLVEVIIAIFVFGVTSWMLVQVGQTINSLTRNANHVNRKVAIESPLSENSNHLIQRDETNPAAAPLLKNDNLKLVDDNLKISMNIGGASFAVNGELYSTKDAVAGDDLASSNADLQVVDVNLELKSGANKWVDKGASTP